MSAAAPTGTPVEAPFLRKSITLHQFIDGIAVVLDKSGRAPKAGCERNHV